MARAALSQSEIDAYRERTIQAATKLFAQHGYAAVTMRAIARELGGSPMTPYRYFENKAEIFAMVRAEAFRQFANGQEAASARSTDPIGRLVEMRSAYFAFALERPNAYRVMFQLDQDRPDRYPELKEQAERSFHVLVSAVTTATDAGMLEGDPVTLAHLLWANVHGLVTLHLAGKLTMGRTLDELREFPGLALHRTQR